MNWNTTSVTAACLAVGLGGFVAGKLAGGSAAGSKADERLECAKQVSIERTSSSSRNDAGSPRRDASSRTSRATGDRTAASIDERLANMEEIVRGENALNRSRSMQAWIDSLAPSEFEAAVAKFRSLGREEERMGEYAMLLTAWAEVDPMTALAYTTKNTLGGMATDTVLTAWASRDPESAIAWAEANHQGEKANPYMVGIIRSLASTDPTRATQLLQALPFSSERDEALRAMVPHLLKDGPKAAKSWIAGLSDVRLRDGATAGFAEEMAKTDPVGTTTWLLANLGEASTSSVDAVFMELAKDHKATALQTFINLPGGDARTRALRGIVTHEAQIDPEAAAKLMNNHPADVDDRVVSNFVLQSYDKAPALAANQIALIEDERSRNRLYHLTLTSWLEEDQAAAQLWINSANLPEAITKSLTKNFSGPIPW